MFVNPLIDSGTMTEDVLWTKIGDLQKRVVIAHQSGNMQMVGQFQSLIEMFSMELENRQTMKGIKEDERKSGVVYDSDAELAELQGLNKKEDKKGSWKNSRD